ncbi:SAICAR synthase-like protein [Neurospora intermedia]|uniref:Kinase n=1 Tax=Neurospora intermedia TaxID=5142 RepID=A0ABR3DBS0_NEUIN
MSNSHSTNHDAAAAAPAAASVSPARLAAAAGQDASSSSSNITSPSAESSPCRLVPPVDPPELDQEHGIIVSAPCLSPGPPPPPPPPADGHQPGHGGAPPPASAAAAAAAAAVPTPTTPLVITDNTTDRTVAHAAAAAAADPIKYHRGPAAYLQRHPSGPGASLLTQAFATARGTNHNNPQQQQQQQQQQPPPPPLADNTLQPQPQVVSSSHLLSAVPSESHTRPPPPPPPPPPPQDHRYSQDEEEDALTPRAGSPRNSIFHKTHTMASMTATVTSTATMTGPPLGNAIELDLRQVNSMLKGHREYLTKNKGRARSPERLESTDADNSTHPVISTKLSESPTALNNNNNNNNNHDGAADNGDNAIPRLRKDQRAQTVPEKAWSIGVGELTDDQDGQVEKSITEVLAGVEPNARSRKASHSLRFFKEGLPDEKSKKKDAKRERLASTAEEAEETETEGEGKSRATTTTVPASTAEDTQLPVTDEPSQARSIPLLTPESPAGSNTAPDYFLSKPVEEPAQLKQQPPATPGHEHTSALQDTAAEFGKSSPSLDRKSEPRRKSDASIEGGSHTEEGEESGEEKISSAVFLPHQGPEEAEEEHSDVPGAASSRTALPSRTHSRAEDFHSWLVKAGEPEVECLDECPDVEKTHRLAKPAADSAATVPFVGSQIDTGKVNGPAVADEIETGVPPPQKPFQSIAHHSHHHHHDHHHHHHRHPEDAVHDHHGEPKEEQPLDAIELIPYKHQVGGHTTLWRFSRRAVCKQLNNRENEFYEKIEQYHRDLLAFLPRYIGVLNVTFQKKPRRKSVHKKDEAAAALEAPAAGQDEATSSGAKENEAAPTTNGAQPAQPEQRMISQSLQQPLGQIPTVTFVDNQHILPRSLIQPALASSSSFTRLRSASSASLHGRRIMNGQCAENPSHMLRPRLEDRHANSWGATMVNKRLRNEVFNDAFLKQPVAVHRHKKGHQRPFSRRSLQPVLRHTESDPNLDVAQDAKPRASSAGEESRLKPCDLVRSEENLASRPRSFREEGVEDDGPKDVTGTSAPEPEILKDATPAQPKKKRRYSGTGLRRKPKDVEDSRGDLQYFEEADSAPYKADNEEPVFESGGVPDVPGEESIGPLDTTHNDSNGTNGVDTSVNTDDLAPSSPPNEIAKIPRPINPKEAQTQTDSRVEYFLLLEDLTAGMKRPCIMDLKMGTRQYGVEASPKKQKSQQGKCAKTTSRELGVRVCGLQVWDVATQSYVFKDKYYGRDLKAGQEFQDALTRFLYNGVDRASILRHIPTVLQKLAELEVIIRRLKGYRFYAASLLMFYDGEPLPPPAPPTPSTTTHSEYDTAMEDYYSTDFATDNDDAVSIKHRIDSTLNGGGGGGSGGKKKKKKDKHEIDFKMADFANCVTAEDLAANGIEGKPCPPQYPQEPDNGFLRGLRSLRRYFLRIQRDVRRELGLGTWRAVDEEIEREMMEDAAYGAEEDEGFVSE